MLALPLLAGFFASATPQVGEVVPDFTATDTEGKQHQLSALVERGPVIVAFFPKAFTSG